jgi:uncharacterized membrane protein YgcG
MGNDEATIPDSLESAPLDDPESSIRLEIIADWLNHGVQWTTDEIPGNARVFDMILLPYSTGGNSNSTVKVVRRPSGGEYVPGALFSLGSMLIIPPRHFMIQKNCHGETESQVKDAFDAALKIYRAGDPMKYKQVPSDGTKDMGYDDSFLSAGGCDRVFFTDKKQTLSLYAWRPSPSFNWKPIGRTLSRYEGIEYLFIHKSIDFSTYQSMMAEEHERETIRIQANPTVDPDDFPKIHIPDHPVITGSSIRFEVVFLAYRYTCLVLNTANHEHNDDNARNIYETNIPTMYMALEAVTSITDRLGIAFSMMKNIVEGIISTWATLDTKRPCAEMTVETSHFMQHLLVATRLGCAIRMSKLKDSIEVAKKKMSTQNFLCSFQSLDQSLNGISTPKNIEGDDFIDQAFISSTEISTTGKRMCYGMTAVAWAKMHLSMATAFLKAYDIYTNFIDMLFGTRRCPRIENPISYSPYKFQAAVRINRYLERMILCMMARTFWFYMEDMKEKYLVPVLTSSTYGRNEKEEVLYVQYIKIPAYMVSMAHCGLACVRPLIVASDLYSYKNGAVQLESLFNGIIEEYQPKITERFSGLQSGGGGGGGGGGNGGGGGQADLTFFPQSSYSIHHPSDSPSHRRIVDFDGLFEYLTIIKGFVSEDSCDYLVGHLTPLYKNYLFTYPSTNSETLDTSLSEQTAIHIPVHKRLIVGSNLVPDSTEMVKKQWWAWVETENIKKL